MVKTIIVTGASSGIGRALAAHLASLNHRVIAVARNNEKLNELQALYPSNITTVTADITQNDGRLKIKQILNSKDAALHVVHNAGIAIPRLINNLSEEEWDEHYLVNVKAPLFLTQLLLPHLLNGGRVLNVSSGLAHFPMPGMVSYGTSKAALFMMKEYCNVELKNKNIFFASAMPGVVDTQIQENMRSYDAVRFPTVEVFQGFFQRNELLAPITVAKFLTWLLLEVSNEQFIKGDWDIYEGSHHEFWDKYNEVKPRTVKDS